MSALINYLCSFISYAKEYPSDHEGEIHDPIDQVNSKSNPEPETEPVTQPVEFSEKNKIRIEQKAIEKERKKQKMIARMKNWVDQRSFLGVKGLIDKGFDPKTFIDGELDVLGYFTLTVRQRLLKLELSSYIGFENTKEMLLFNYLLSVTPRDHYRDLVVTLMDERMILPRMLSDMIIKRPNTAIKTLEELSEDSEFQDLVNFYKNGNDHPETVNAFFIDRWMAYQ